METKYPAAQINMETWHRKKHFQLYRNHSYPYVGLTTRLDITRLYGQCRNQKARFFPLFLYLALMAMNGVENFRYRLGGKQDVFLCEKIGCSYTVLNKQSDLFYFAYVDQLDNFEAFNSALKTASQKALDDEYLANERMDVFYLSALPWVDFTQVIQPLSLSPDDCIPRVTIGKYVHAASGTSMSVSCLSHHAFCDGLHIGRFFNKLEELLANFNLGT